MTQYWGTESADVGLDMSINVYKYNAHWKMVRNGLTIKRCTDSKQIIWPFQKMVTGEELYQWPTDTYWLTPRQYTYLKLQGQVE